MNFRLEFSSLNRWVRKKNHYLLTQLAEFLLQLYENGIKGVKVVKRTLVQISDGLLECL